MPHVSIIILHAFGLKSRMIRVYTLGSMLLEDHLMSTGTSKDFRVSVHSFQADFFSHAATAYYSTQHTLKLWCSCQSESDQKVGKAGLSLNGSEDQQVGAHIT